MITKIDQNPNEQLGHKFNIREVYLWENIVIAAYQNHGLAYVIVQIHV